MAHKNEAQIEVFRCQGGVGHQVIMLRAGSGPMHHFLTL